MLMRQNAIVALKLIPLFSMLVLTSCREIRAIPGHGGGKRFSEEQRAMTKSIRAAVDDMELKELKGKTVRIVLQSIAHSGGGSTRLPGWTSFDARKTISSSLSTVANNTVGGYTNLVDPKFFLGKDETSTGPRTNNNNFSDRNETRYSDNRNFNHGYRYQPNATVNTHSVSTNSDLNYLNSVLQMKCHHENIILSGKGEYTLYVLVDILGTNRSKNDLIAYTRDKLTGECEISYYVMNKANSIHVPLRKTGAKSVYSEQAVIGFNIDYPRHRLKRFSPDKIMSFGSKNEGTMINRSAKNKNHIIDMPLKQPLFSKEDPDELANQIDSYIKEGDNEKAKALFKKLKKIDKNHPSLEGFASTLEQ
jgi:hypothetical protein